MNWLRAYFWLGLVLLAGGLVLLGLAVASHFTDRQLFSAPPYLAAMTLSIAGSVLLGIGRASRKLPH